MSRRSAPSSSSPRSLSATATSSCAPGPAPARPRCWSIASAPPRSIPRLGSSEILAFTFTERAADQLRRRVREELGRASQAGCGRRSSRPCARREEATDRAWISTIHGFCRRLLASHPAAAGIDPRFRVIDEAEAERLAGRAFDAALEELVEGGEAEALELAAANRRRTLLEMTRGAYDELRSHGDPAPALPQPPPVDPGPTIGDLIEAAREAHVECAEAKGSKGLISRERIAAAMELDPNAQPGEELLERLASLAIVSPGKSFEGEACERYAPCAEASTARRRRPGPRARLRAAAGAGRAATESATKQLKSERSGLDFEDLQLKTVELLRGIGAGSAAATASSSAT